MSGKLELLVRELMADRRKLAIMVVLLMVALLLWGRLLLKKVPQIATAEPVSPLAATPPGPVDDLPAPLLSQGPLVRLELPPGPPPDLFGFNRTACAWLFPPRIEPAQAKSGPDASDEQVRPSAVREAAQRLRLQSVVMGQTPHAVINGQVLSPGQRIEGFVLQEVSPRQVVLERDGIIIRLGM